MAKANRFYNRIESFAALFFAQQCTRAYTETGDPARRPGIPQPWYWHGLYGRGQLGSI